MGKGQTIPALIAALLRHGVTPEAIEAAIADVLDLRLASAIGQSLSHDNLLHRAFAFEQARRLCWRP